MPLTVLTTNSFLELAMRSLYEDAGHTTSLCIIDVRSFRSLRQILYELLALRLPSRSRVLLLGDNTICSKMLHPLPVWPRSTTVLHLKKKMLTGEPLNTVLERIYACRGLDALTKRERWLARLLLAEKSIKALAIVTGWSEKNLHNRAGTIAEKLNLRSGREVLIFLDQEFSNKSDDHVE